MSAAGHFFGAERPTVCPWGHTLVKRRPLPGHHGLGVLSPLLENLLRVGAARDGWPQSGRLWCRGTWATVGGSRRAGSRARYGEPQWLCLALRKDRWQPPRRFFRIVFLSPGPLTPKVPRSATPTSSQSAERPSSRPSLGLSRPRAPFLALQTLPSRKVAPAGDVGVVVGRSLRGREGGAGPPSPRPRLRS